MSDKKSFLKQFDHIAATFPIQGDARANIHNGLDFPTTRDEDWKYTRVSPILKDDYKQHDVEINNVEQHLIPSLDAARVVFVNGEFSEKLSTKNLPSGIEISSMANTSGERKNLMLLHLGKHIDSQKNAFNAFNTSYFKDGVFITVDPEAKVEEPIHILHISIGEKQANNIRNLIHVGRFAEVSFIMHYSGEENEGSFSNVVNEVVAENGAQGALYILQNEGASSSQINSTQIVQQRDSHFKVVTLTQSGGLIRNNLNFTIGDEGCQSDMYGIYFTSGKQHVDNHTYADHIKPNCNSNELYKGVMTDRSTGVFNGKIMVHQDAQKINAFQSNQNILLSDSATINTKPELEIYADDVKCSHGCTIGQLDEEALFYLRSRGLGVDAATKLLIQAFAGDVLDQIDVVPLRDSMQQFIQEKFAQLDA